MDNLKRLKGQFIKTEQTKHPKIDYMKDHSAVKESSYGLYKSNGMIRHGKGKN